MAPLLGESGWGGGGEWLTRWWNQPRPWSTPSRARERARQLRRRSPFELGITVAIVLAVLVPLFVVNLFASGSAHSAEQVLSDQATPGPAPLTTSTIPAPVVVPPVIAPQTVTPGHGTGSSGTGAGPRAVAAPSPTVPSTTAPTTTPTTAPPTATAAGCDGDAPTTPDGTQWANCSWQDNFADDNSTLNRSQWIPQQTNGSGYHSGRECFEDSPNNVSVSGGTLNLTVRQEATSSLCPGLPLPYFTPYTSGMVSTYHRFSQTYGLFEVNAKLPATSVQGLQETFWLWPVNSQYYGGIFPDSGEIDFAEFYSTDSFPATTGGVTSNATWDTPFIHYNGDVFDTNDTANCTVTHPEQFHTYGVEWTPNTLTILLDGQACLVDTWHPIVPESGNDPFNQPFIISLTQALGIYSNEFVPGATPLPATTSIAWVRVWK